MADAAFGRAVEACTTAAKDVARQYVDELVRRGLSADEVREIVMSFVDERIMPACGKALLEAKNLIDVAYADASPTVH